MSLEKTVYLKAHARMRNTHHVHSILGLHLRLWKS